jgi:phytoene dehydrogenase-like protein
MKKIIIVGAGVSGLSAAIYAQTCGFQTEIYEKNSAAGGQCIGWNRKGNHIDNCIHWLTGTKAKTAFFSLWETLGVIGNGIKLIDPTLFFASEFRGKTVTWWKDIKRTRRELCSLSPNDAKAINRLLKDVETLQHFQMPVRKPLNMMNLWDLIVFGAKMLRVVPVVIRYNTTTIGDLVKRFESEDIKAAILAFQTPDLLAIPFIFAYGTLTSGNGMIPEGGSVGMIERMVAKYESLGGKLFLNSSVAKVTLNGNGATGIQLDNGQNIEADYVVCATDYFETINKLLGHAYMNDVMRRAFNNLSAYPLISSFHAAFAVDEDACPFTDTFWIDCEPFSVAGTTLNRIGLREYSHLPHYSPEGKNIIQVRVVQKEKDFKFWESLSKEEYVAEKRRLAEVFRQRIIARFPKAAAYIECLDTWTPLTYKRYCNAYQGAYMSFFKTKKYTEKIYTSEKVKGLDNVYLASQWTLSPGGLPIAAVSGKFAVQRILKAENRPYII